MLQKITLISPHWDEAKRVAFAGAIEAEFPSVLLDFDESNDDRVHVRASQWERADFDSWRFDCEIDALAREPFTLRVADDREERIVFPLEVLNRCQRAIDRRNPFSQGQLFERVLRRHRQLHDLSKPLVLADYKHAVDTWQWLLRLDETTSLAVQLAALFHDVERLASEADERVEHLAGDYQKFKNAHAARGAEMTAEILNEGGVDGATCERVAAIVASHEQQGADAEIALLNDADALSYFSLNSSGYADYFGPEQTRRKIAYTWNRMRDGARAKLSAVRLRQDVAALLDEVRQSAA